MDDTLAPFGLPVHLDVEKALPRAAKAFLDIFPHTENSKEVIAICEGHDPPFGDASQRLAVYLRLKQEVFKSWVSYALLDPNSGEPVGVLNIHSRLEHTLAEDTISFLNSIHIITFQLGFYAKWLMDKYTAEEAELDGAG